MLAAIPYTTFPVLFEVGPLTVRTFGLMVALGVVLGAWVAARYIEAHAGIEREETYRMAFRLVVAGVVGARLLYVVTHPETVDSFIDIFAVWEGGLQFSGGFIGAIIFGLPFFRRWDTRTRWVALDGYAMGLAIGLAIGRIGCYAVGEHFGRTTDFFGAVRYDGGETREGLGDLFTSPADLEANGVGTVFHQTALYELVYMLVLFGVLWLLQRKPRPVGTLIGVFCTYYGITRFWSDSLRVNDERFAGMTGAQYFCIGLLLASIWIWAKVRPALARLPEPAEDEVGEDEVGEDEVGEDEVGDGAAPAEVDDGAR